MPTRESASWLASELVARAPDADARVLEDARDRGRLAHGHGDGVGREAAEDGAGDALAEGLDELVLLGRGDLLHHLEDALVVDGLPDAVRRPGGAEVELDLEIEQHGPAGAALGGRDPERGRDLDPLEQDRVLHESSGRRAGRAPRPA